MYNVNKGNSTPEESEILEPIHRCLRELVELERIGKPYPNQFTDYDVVAITLLYSMVMGNRLLYQLKEEKVGIEFAQIISNYFASTINQTTNGMSGVDVKGYYKPNKEQK